MNKNVALVRDRDTFKQGVVLALFFCFVGCLALILKSLYSLPLQATFLWVFGVFLCFYVPGNLVMRWSHLNRDNFFLHLILSLSLGVALIPLVYTALRRISHPELVYPFGGMLFLLWLILLFRDIRRKKPFPEATFSDLISIVILILVILIFLHLTHFTDIIFSQSGFKFRNIYLNETVYHLGIINALKDVFPTFYPYAIGVPGAHYHISMHLQIEMFYRLFGFDTLKLTFFYFPLLYFSLIVTLPYLYVCKYMNSRVLGVVAGIIIFGSGLSFIPGLLDMAPPNYPWAALFRSTIWSLFTLNSFIPAILVMFLCVVYLKSFYEKGNISCLFVVALLGFSAYSFKSSMGPHVMAAVFITGFASLVIEKDMKRFLLLSGMAGLAIIAMVIDLTLIRGGGPADYIIKIDLLNTFQRSLEKLGASDLPWIILVLIFLFYVLGSFGVRALGFYVMKDGCKKTFFDPVIVFLLVFTVSGFLLPDIIFIGFPQSKIGTHNNAGWFGAQALIGSWLLLAFFLARYKHKGKKFIVLLIVVIFLSAPSTVQFLKLRYNTSYYLVDHDALEVVKFLENTDPESVVLHPPNLDGPSLASNLAGRQTVISFFQSYVIQSIAQEEADKRYEDVTLFFDTNEKTDREAILKKYSVDYIYTAQSPVSVFDNDPQVLLVLRNSTYSVYEVKQK
jgi:hypothetical protein